MLQKLDKLGLYEEADVILKISQQMILQQLSNRLTLLEQKINEIENNSGAGDSQKQQKDFDLDEQNNTFPQDININL